MFLRCSLELTEAGFFTLWSMDSLLSLGIEVFAPEKATKWNILDYTVTKKTKVTLAHSCLLVFCLDKFSIDSKNTQ